MVWLGVSFEFLTWVLPTANQNFFQSGLNSCKNTQTHRPNTHTVRSKKGHLNYWPVFSNTWDQQNLPDWILVTEQWTIIAFLSSYYFSILLTFSLCPRNVYMCKFTAQKWPYFSNFTSHFYKQILMLSLKQDLSNIWPIITIMHTHVKRLVVCAQMWWNVHATQQHTTKMRRSHSTFYTCPISPIQFPS